VDLPDTAGETASVRSMHDPCTTHAQPRLARHLPRRRTPACSGSSLTCCSAAPSVVPVPDLCVLEADSDHRSGQHPGPRSRPGGPRRTKRFTRTAGCRSRFGFRGWRMSTCGYVAAPAAGALLRRPPCVLAVRQPSGKRCRSVGWRSRTGTVATRRMRSFISYMITLALARSRCDTKLL
jgi:hypothetical protein